MRKGLDIEEPPTISALGSEKLTLARRYLTLLLLIICLIVLSVFWGFGYNAGSLIKDQLHHQGRAFAKEIILTRQWAASYGGVYVEMHPGVEVNPHLLKVPHLRTVLTDKDGTRFTLKNPALMTREISQLAAEKGVMKFSITSMTPLNQSNQPDAFERTAFAKFLGGAKEYASLERRGSGVVYRYMVPLMVEKPCLHCHLGQNKREGEIMGGISVTIPATSMLKELTKNRVMLVLSAFAIVLLIFLIITYISKALIERLRVTERKLVEMASKDFLTGLLNRREMFSRLATEASRADRYSKPLSLILLDIDHFKAINDSHGHCVGDLVLKQLSESINVRLRKHDLLCRYGGEEFLIAAPETNAEMAFKLAERLRATPMEVAIGAGRSLTVTISAGVAERLLGEDLDKVITRADTALYRAKESGRDRVELAVC